MTSLIREFEKKQIERINANRKPFPKFSAGDTVSVKYKITEGANTRLQAFQGVVIAKTKGNGHYSETFTVRKISSNVGVERKFMINSPLVDSIEVMKQGVVRRAKLYYLRELTGKASRIKEKLDFFDKATTAEEKAEVKAKKGNSKTAAKVEESSKTENEDKKD